jgi:hypothetical protein
MNRTLLAKVWKGKQEARVSPARPLPFATQPCGVNGAWIIAPGSTLFTGSTTLTTAMARQKSPNAKRPTLRCAVLRLKTGIAIRQPAGAARSELKGDEPPTAERLMKSPEFTGKNLRGFKDTDNPDFIDDYKRTYDAVAGPTAWASPRLNMDRMVSQIQRHIYDKDGIDFTVLDLTGASGAQIDEVFKSLDKWASNPEMHPKSRLIILGGGY